MLHTVAAPRDDSRDTLSASDTAHPSLYSNSYISQNLRQGPAGSDVGRDDFYPSMIDSNRDE